MSINFLSSPPSKKSSWVQLALAISTLILFLLVREKQGLHPLSLLPLGAPEAFGVNHNSGSALPGPKQVINGPITVV